MNAPFISNLFSRCGERRRRSSGREASPFPSVAPCGLIRLNVAEGIDLPQVVIENPVLNSAYREPTRHFRFAEDGITDEIVEARRLSSYFIPIPPPKKRGPQLVLPGDWTAE